MELEFELYLPPQPKHDVDETMYQIFEQIGCGDIPGSGTFGNRDGVVLHDFRIKVPNSDILDLVLSMVVDSGLELDGASVLIHDIERDLLQYCRARVPPSQPE